MILDTRPAPLPERVILRGGFVTVAPVDPALHGDSLWSRTGGIENAPLWDYMADGPFPDRAGFDASLHIKAQSADPLFFAIVDNKTDKAVGIASLMRIDAKNRVIEVGGNRLQRSVAGDARRHEGDVSACMLRVRGSRQPPLRVEM